MEQDCQKAKELMSGAVDNELSEEEYSFFDRHIESCKTCRNEFELEKLTQTYFKEKVGLLDPPDDLLESIRERLSEEDAIHVNRRQIPILRFHRYLWPALGIAIISIFVIVSAFLRKSDKPTSEFSEEFPFATMQHTTDALILSDYGFQNVLRGEFHSQITTHNADNIIEFIKRKAGYSIPLPVIHDADWIGGNVTMLQKEKVVNVVYKMGKSYIYVYAFPTSLAHANQVSLSRKCIKTLDRNEWFWNHGTKGELQVAWGYKNCVCVVTSNLDQSNLMTYLKTSKDIGDNGWH